MTAEAKITVRQVVELVEKNERHHYRYDGNGSGCLSWSMKLIADFIAAGWLKNDAETEFEKFIEQTRKTEPNYWIPPDAGTFI